MTFRRMFSPEEGTRPVAAGDDAETETVRRIARALEQVDPARRKFLAGFAYVLARAAHADLDISEDESRLMEHIVCDIGGLPAAQAVMVVEIARNQTELYSGTEDYLVTREFNRTATDEERRSAVAACFAVVAADHEITSAEYAEMTEIAEELGLSRPELNAIRAEYSDQLTAIKLMRGQQAGSAGGSNA